MVKLFVEGGGDSDSLKTECRRGFRHLLDRAGLKGRMPRVVPCGGRKNAFEQFCTELEGGGTDGAFLLVDAEDPVTRASPWEHVAQRHGDEAWFRPDGATEDHLHLMVQCMEAWFVADRRALRDFYGQGFQEGALPATTSKTEEVGKRILCDKLEQATRNTKTKGIYSKGQHSFKLLAMLDPSVVRKASPWADRFFATLDRLLK
jgi:hypothetical protein